MFLFGTLTQDNFPSLQEDIPCVGYVDMAEKNFRHEEMSPLTMAFARLALRGRLPMPLLGLCLGHQSLGVAEARRDDQGDGQ